MKAFKSFILALFIVLSVIGCGNIRKTTTAPEVYGTSMRIVFNRDFTYAQFDSICVADTIPMDLRLWKAYSTRDFETNDIITEYLYIKRLGVSEEMFRLMIVDEDTYNIYKRITYGNKEK